MKILFVYQYCLLGGVTTQLVNRLKGLEDEWDVHFLFLGDYGGRVAFNGYNKLYIFNNPKEFRELLDHQKFDTISVIDTNQVYGWLKQCDFRGLVVNEVHTTTQNLEKVRMLKEEKIIDLIVTPSQYMKHVLENTYEFKNQIPVEVVSNCIDLSQFVPVNEFKNRSNPLILWVGKLDDHKKWYDFVEIAKKLEHEYQYRGLNLNYMMIGGITAKQEVVDQLMAQLLQQNLLHKMTWYSAIDYNDMQKIYGRVYKSGGVYVSTTINESFGMTVLEAMCMQVPLVVPRVGALEELCAPYRQHLLYTQGRLDEACKKIVKQIGSCINYDVAMYSTESVCDKFKSILTYYFKQLKR